MVKTDDSCREFLDNLIETYFIYGEALTWRQFDELYFLLKKINSKQPSFEGEVEGKITINENDHNQPIP